RDDKGPGRSRQHTVTTAQRARLVVAMGLLNLILATVALTAGLVVPSGPSGPSGGIAAATPGPSATTATSPAEASPTSAPSAAGPADCATYRATAPARDRPADARAGCRQAEERAAAVPGRRRWSARACQGPAAGGPAMQRPACGPREQREVGEQRPRDRPA